MHCGIGSWSGRYLSLAAYRQGDGGHEGNDRRLWALVLPSLTTDQIEEASQHEVLNWFCLLGAMESTRPQARPGNLHRDLGIRVACRLRVLPPLE